MAIKYLTFLVLIIAIATIISGCGRKPSVDNNAVSNKSEKNNQENIATTTNNEITTSTNNKTSSTTEININSWQTYKNKEYEFEFKFPEGWYWEDYTKEFNVGRPVFGFYPKDKKREWEYYGDIVLDIFKNTKKIDVEQYFKNEHKNESYLFDDLIIGNTKNGYRYVEKYDLPGMINSDFAYIQCNESIISLSTPLGISREIINEILDTVRCQK